MTEEAPERREVGGPQEPDPMRREERTCPICGVRLSAYNRGPYCWRHAMAYPWRGPSAKPRFER